MTRLLLECTDVVAERSRGLDFAMHHAVAGSHSPAGGNVATLCAAVSGEVGEQLKRAVETAEELENVWRLLMANPAVRVAYQRYQGIYGAVGLPGASRGGVDESGGAAPRCNERVSDLLVTFRELAKLGPAQWNCLRRDYASAADEVPTCRTSWSPARYLLRLASSLSGWA